MEDSKLLRYIDKLKELKCKGNLNTDYHDYLYNFNKIMNSLDENDIIISKRFKNLLFDAGLADGSCVGYLMLIIII